MAQRRGAPLSPRLPGLATISRPGLRIEKGESIYIDYETQVSGYGYVGTYIKIEFGARSTGEPDS